MKKRLIISLLFTIILTFTILTSTQYKKYSNTLSDDIKINQSTLDNLALDANYGAAFFNRNFNYTATETTFFGATLYGSITGFDTKNTVSIETAVTNNRRNLSLGNQIQFNATNTEPGLNLYFPALAQNTQRYFETGSGVTDSSGNRIHTYLRVEVQVLSGAPVEIELVWYANNQAVIGTEIYRATHTLSVADNTKAYDLYVNNLVPNAFGAIKVKSSSTQESHVKIHKFQFIGGENYESYNFINRAYDSSQNTRLILKPLSEMSTYIQNIRTSADQITTTIGQSSKTRMNDFATKLEGIVNRLTPYYQTIDNFYTNQDKIILRQNLIASELSDFITSIDNLSEEEIIHFKNDILNKANAAKELFDYNFNRSTTRTALTNEVIKHRTLINSIPGLSTETRTNYMTALNTLQSATTSNINRVTLSTGFSQIQTDFTLEFVNLGLTHARTPLIPRSLTDRDNAVESINQLTSLNETQKTNYITALNNFYNSFISFNESVELGQNLVDAYNNYTTSIFNSVNEASNIDSTNINDAKNTSKDEVQFIHDVNVGNEIDNMQYLSESEKEPFFNQAGNILEQGFRDIDGVVDFTELAPLRSNIIAALISKLNEARYADRKINFDNVIEARTNTFNQSIDRLLELTQTQVTNYKNEILNAKQSAESAITAESTLTEFNTALQTNQTTLDNILLNASKVNQNAIFDKKLTELTDKINQMEAQTDQSKADKIAQIEQMINDAKESVNNQTGLSNLETVARNNDQLITQNVELYEEKNKAKLELRLEAGSNPSAEMLELLRQKETLIDEATNQTDLNEKTLASKNEIDNQAKTEQQSNFDTTINNYFPGEKSPEVQALIDEYQTRINNANNYDEALTILNRAQEAALSRKKVESLILVDNLISNTYKTPQVVSELNRIKQLVQDGTNPTNIDQILTDARLSVFNVYKEGIKNNLNNLAGVNPSEALQAILDDVLKQIDDALTITDVESIQTNSSRQIQDRAEIENDLSLLNQFYDIQIKGYNLTEEQRSSVESLLAQQNTLLSNNETTLADARVLILNLVKQYVPQSFTIKNGDFDLLDNNLAYPSNEENLVLAGLTNPNGFLEGTTIDITRLPIGNNTQSNLLNKFRTGTITVPNDSVLTSQELSEKLTKMTFVRQLEIHLLDRSQTRIIDFSGNYIVSLLIPESYRTYDEFLVVYETPNGVEVFKTYRTNAWLTFETTHFSSFYILGENKETTEPTPEPNPEPNPDNQTGSNNELGVLEPILISMSAVALGLMLLAVFVEIKRR